MTSFRFKKPDLPANDKFQKVREIAILRKRQPADIVKFEEIIKSMSSDERKDRYKEINNSGTRLIEAPLWYYVVNSKEIELFKILLKYDEKDFLSGIYERTDAQYSHDNVRITLDDHIYKLRGRSATFTSANEMKKLLAAKRENKRIESCRVCGSKS